MTMTARGHYQDQGTALNPEIIKQVRRLWRKGKAFYLCATVSAPYDGCFYEPNIWLVTPPKSEEYAELMANVPARYAPEREEFTKKYQSKLAARQSAVFDFDWEWKKARGWLGDAADAEGIEKLVELFDAMDAADRAVDVWEEIKPAIEKRCPPMKQPRLVVWPLYASGQGIGMDAVHSLSELEQVIGAESCEQLSRRSSWPDGLLGTRFEDVKQWGRIRDWQASEMGPINKAVYAGERYWMKALEVAESEYDLELSWHCDQCDQDIVGAQEECEPVSTGYHGDGGIGVHYTDVMCRSCVDAGMCERCKEHYAAHEGYSSDVAKHGWSLCIDCAEQLFSAAFCGPADDLDVPGMPETVWLGWYKEPTQLEIAGCEVGKKLVLATMNADYKVDRILVEIEVDAGAVMDAIEKDGTYNLQEDIDPDEDRGLYLSWYAVRDIAQKYWDDRAESDDEEI